MVRAKGVDPSPPVTVNLTVKRPFFDDFPEAKSVLNWGSKLSSGVLFSPFFFHFSFPRQLNLLMKKGRGRGMVVERVPLRIVIKIVKTYRKKLNGLLIKTEIDNQKTEK